MAAYLTALAVMVTNAHERAMREVLLTEGHRIRLCARPDSERCRRRLCPRCQAHAAGRVRRDVLALIRAADERGAEMALLRFSVAVHDVADGLATLGACFPLLRRRVSWSHHIIGGASFVEAEPSESGTGLWNAHAHCIGELSPGHVLEHGPLLADWLQLLARRDLVGGIDLRPVYGRFKRLAGYVTKRPRTPWLELSAAQLYELATSLPGTRTVCAFGNWRGSARKAAKAAKKSKRPAACDAGEQPAPPGARSGGQP
jgi:hypothetical protein